MKRNNKIRNLIIIVLGSGVLIYIIFIVYKGTIEDSRNPISVSNAIPDEYINLFNSSAKQNIAVKSAVGFKLRNTVCYLTYNDNYDIEITKININPSFDLNQNLVESYKKIESTIGDGYLPEYETDYTTNYKSKSPDTISKIYLSLDGDSIRTLVKNDSVACYSLELKKVGVQYHTGVNEILIEAKTSFLFFKHKQPIGLLFLKKHETLYFLTLSSKNKALKLNPDLLIKLIKKG